MEIQFFDSYKNPIEGKTYVSPSINEPYNHDKTIRLVTRAIEQKESYTVAKIKDEIVLRETPGGKKIIKATVYEHPRLIKVLNIQEYTPSTGSPHKNGFAFIGEEILSLYKFIKDVIAMDFGSERYQRLSDDDIQYIEITDKQAKQIFTQNKEMFTNIIRSGITTEDVVAIGYRKKQLDVFEKLLNDITYFEHILKIKKCKKESLWQQFFEKNQWIFGYGLGYVFLTGLNDKKLEQVVKGFDVASHGKRVDALMKTRGIISNLCFVEIKTHHTKLLEDKPYRSGCYAASRELSGAISQVQVSITEATKNLSDKISMDDENGNPTGEEIFNYKPKAFLVIGSLNEFNSEHGVNKDKLRSFELFRKSIINPEIITFDELYERAKFITNTIENDNG